MWSFCQLVLKNLVGIKKTRALLAPPAMKPPP